MKVKKILSNLFLIMAIVFLVFVVYSSIQSKKQNKELFILGFKPYLISTGSMEPYLKVNSIVILKQGGYDSVVVGDVIGFKTPGLDKNVCHRVTNITNDGFETKGDNNDNPDPIPVTMDMYVGKIVFKSNIPSTIMYLAKTTHGRIMFIGLPILIVILIIVGVRLLKKK